MRILVAEDDSAQLAMLCAHLVQYFRVETAQTGHEAWHRLKQGTDDLAVLDIHMPGMDGLEVCRRLRAEHNAIPLLLVTASDADHQCRDGLNAGADDYMQKPLNIEELVARMHALLRRSGRAPASVLAVGALVLDGQQRRVVYAGRPLPFTPREYALLELFMRHPGRVFSRAELIGRVWGPAADTLEDSVKAHIKGLRRKLAAAGACDVVQTMHGMGYRLAPDKTRGA